MKAQKLTFPILLLLLTAGLFVQSCDLNARSIKGSGNVVTIEKSLDSFDALHVSGMFKVVLIEGNSPHISIETDDNLQEYVESDVRGNTLSLGMRPQQSYDPTHLEVYITVNSLSEIKLSGATELSSEHTLTASNLTITISGAADMDLSVKAESLSTSVSGAGAVNISGSADSHRIRLSGVAAINCLDLSTTSTDCTISGAGSAKVNTTDHLEARVSGVGSIEYAGNPTHKNLNTSGVGSIKQINR